MGTIDLKDYPAVLFTSLDGTRAMLDDDRKVTIATLSVLYNELRAECQG